MCEDEDIPVCVKNCPNEALKFKEVNSKSLSDESLAGEDSNE
jgi:Fe-S-cluster-containing dehydrogenase component